MFVKKSKTTSLFFPLEPVPFHGRIYVVLGTGNEQNIYSLREITAARGMFFLQTFIPYRETKNTRFFT